MLAVGKVVVFNRFFAIFGKKYDSVQKNCQHPFSAIFKTKNKVPMTNKLEGGGGLKF